MIGLYLVFGLLNISGNGLSNLGNIVEGMSEEKKQEKIEELAESLAKLKEKLLKKDEKVEEEGYGYFDQLDGDLLDIIRIKKKHLGMTMVSMIVDQIKKKGSFSTTGGKKDMFQNMYEKYEFLERVIKNPEGEASSSGSGSGSKSSSTFGF